MRASLVILAALTGHSAAIPCRPHWVVKASLSWESASTRLDKLLSQIPTVYLGGDTVPPNATIAETTITTTITTFPVSVPVTTSADEDNAVTTASAKAGGNTSASGPVSTGGTTTTTTTITVTPSTTDTATASAAATSTEADEASEEVAETEDAKVHRRTVYKTLAYKTPAYPKRRQLTSYTTTTLPCATRTPEPEGLKTTTPWVCPYAARPERRQLTSYTTTTLPCPARTPESEGLKTVTPWVCPYAARPAPPAVVYTTIYTPVAHAALASAAASAHDAHTEADKAKDPKMHRRDFEGSEEEAKDLEILATLAQSKMSEATRMREVFDKDLKEYVADRDEINAERISLKKEHTKARYKMMDAREWEKKFNKAAKEYDAKQKKWEKETAKKTALEKLEKQMVRGSTRKNGKRSEPKRSELDLKTSDLVKEEYEDGLYAGIGDKLLNGFGDTKKPGGYRYLLTKQCNGSRCPKGKNMTGAEQGEVFYKVEEVAPKTEEEEGEKEKAEQKKVELKKETHQGGEEDQLLANGDEHGQYVRLSTLYMQYRSMLAEAIQKQLDPVLKDEKYAAAEAMEEHEKGNEEEQRKRLSILYMDFRYMLLPKFKKQLDPILYDAKV
ncbi:hypothetical protein ACHAPU_007302 [Fusarium lateritium]